MSPHTPFGSCLCQPLGLDCAFWKNLKDDTIVVRKGCASLYILPPRTNHAPSDLMIHLPSLGNFIFFSPMGGTDFLLQGGFLSPVEFLPPPPPQNSAGDTFYASQPAAGSIWSPLSDQITEFLTGGFFPLKSYGQLVADYRG